jgi:hypothetical protein
VRGFHEEITANEEEAAHRIGNFAAANSGAEAAAQSAQSHAPGREFTHAAAFDIAAANDDIEIFGFQLVKHVRQNLLIMLEVRIHDGEERRGCTEHSLNAGRGQAAAIDALNDADPRISPGDGAHEIRRAIGRIVIDKNDFVLDATERLFETRQDDSNVRAFFERGDHDGEFDVASERHMYSSVKTE